MDSASFESKFKCVELENATVAEAGLHTGAGYGNLEGTPVFRMYKRRWLGVAAVVRLRFWSSMATSMGHVHF